MAPWQTARDRVWRWVGLHLSIGIAPTRVLAKIATRVAKKNPDYGGVCNLAHCGSVDSILAGVDVGDIWGIGRRGALKLKLRGIANALQLRDADAGHIRKLLTVTGLNVLMELRGIPAIGEDIPLTHGSVISSRSLGYKVTTLSHWLKPPPFMRPARVKSCAAIICRPSWFAFASRHPGQGKTGRSMMK